VLKRIVRDFCVIWMCLLIVLLPGCTALMPWLAGEKADIEKIEKELDSYKEAIRQADTNADGKLGLKEGILAAIGLGGAAVVRNKMSDKRKAKIEAEIAQLQSQLSTFQTWMKAANAPGATMPAVPTG